MMNHIKIKNLRKGSKTYSVKSDKIEFKISSAYNFVGNDTTYMVTGLSIPIPPHDKILCKLGFAIDIDMDMVIGLIEPSKRLAGLPIHLQAHAIEKGDIEEVQCILVNLSDKTIVLDKDFPIGYIYFTKVIKPEIAEVSEFYIEAE